MVLCGARRWTQSSSWAQLGICYASMIVQRERKTLNFRREEGDWGEAGFLIESIEERVGTTYAAGCYLCYRKEDTSISSLY